MFIRTKHTTLIQTKRLLIAGALAAILAVVSSVVVSSTFAGESAHQASSTNSLSTGTVSLTAGATDTCAVSSLAPGDSSSGYKPSGSLVGTGSDSECSITVSYAGSVPAYIGLDLGISSTAGTVTGPADGLFDGSSTGLQLLIKDNQGTPITYVNGTTYLNKSGAAQSMTSGVGVTDLLVNTSTFKSSSSSVTFSLDYYLPTTSTSGYQGATSSFTLTVHAVQSGNDNPSGCSTGRQCPAVSGGFQWS